LWVIYRIHTQEQLGVIRVPTAFADQHVDVFGLDDQTTQFLQLKAEIATIALRDRIFAGRKPIAHFRL